MQQEYQHKFCSNEEEIYASNWKIARDYWDNLPLNIFQQYFCNFTSKEKDDVHFHVDNRNSMQDQPGHLLLIILFLSEHSILKQQPNENFGFQRHFAFPYLHEIWS